MEFLAWFIYLYAVYCAVVFGLGTLVTVGALVYWLVRRMGGPLRVLRF